MIARYLDGAHLFHGSERAGLTVLEPAVPHADVGSDPANKDHAVYATDDPCAAIMFALTDGFDGVWRLTFEPTTAHFPRTYAERLRHNVGALYVVARADFAARDGWQYKTEQAVVPVAELAVSLRDFEKLGGVLELDDP